MFDVSPLQDETSLDFGHPSLLPHRDVMSLDLPLKPLIAWRTFLLYQLTCVLSFYLDLELEVVISYIAYLHIIVKFPSHVFFVGEYLRMEFNALVGLGFAINKIGQFIVIHSWTRQLF